MCPFFHFLPSVLLGSWVRVSAEMWQHRRAKAKPSESFFLLPAHLLQPASPHWPSWIVSMTGSQECRELFRLAEVVAHVPRKTNSLLWDSLLTLFHPNMHLPCYLMTNMDITPHTFILHVWICHPDLCLAWLGEGADGLVPKQNLLSWDQTLVCVFNSLLVPVCKEWLQLTGTFAERLFVMRSCL